MKLTVDQAMRKAAKLAAQGQRGEAERIYREILQAFPANTRALSGLRALGGATSEDPPPHDVQALVGLYNQGRLRELAEGAASLLRRYPNAALLHLLAGVAHAGLRDFEKALASFDSAIERNPAYADAHYNRGIVLQDLKRPDQALKSYDEALRLKPDYAEAHDNRGAALQELGRLDEAVRSHDNALQLRPDYAAAHYNRGNALRELARFDDAIASYDRVLQLDPAHAEALNNRGNALMALRRFDQALADYDKAISLKPDYAEAHHNRGNALQDLNRLDDAVASFDRALQLRPGYAEAHNNRALVLQDLNRLDEALAGYDSALRLQPDFAEAYHNRCTAAARMCAWDARGLAPVVEGTPPFAALSIADDPMRQLELAQACVANAKFPAATGAIAPPNARPAKLRIGYFSADFHGHAVMFLIARLFELHDRNRFEVHAFSYGIDKQDEMRRRVASAVDRFHEVRGLPDGAVAALARKEGVDIAVDLNGHTGGGRLGIFAHRAAPIQINYLGYPGTNGAGFIDYIIADKIVAPPAARAFFSEKVISLPHSYQVNDDQRAIGDKRFERPELGLPANGFVFCCFNNSFKISPTEVDVWMRLLGAIDGSVLWLLKDNKWAEANLRREAEARGADPARLVFAERMPPADHLARHRCADLFLDTFTYNAHTTASDALWTGLPVVTKQGGSFAARVASSLLHAIGMPELVAGTAEAYERLALELAANPDRLAEVRAKLAANRLTTPLFDSEQYRRHIERAYDLAYDRFLDRLAPDHIDVD